MLLISDSKLGSRTSAGLGERPSAAPSLCSLPTDLAESRLSLLCICNLKASDGPLRVPPVSCVQLNIGSNKAWANCKCQGGVLMCIQMQKKVKRSPKELKLELKSMHFNHFTCSWVPWITRLIQANISEKPPGSASKLQTYWFPNGDPKPWTPFWEMILIQFLSGGIPQELFSLCFTFCNGQLLWRGWELRTSLRSKGVVLVAPWGTDWNQTTVRYHKRFLMCPFVPCAKPSIRKNSMLSKKSQGYQGLQHQNIGCSSKWPICQALQAYH